MLHESVICQDAEKKLSSQGITETYLVEIGTKQKVACIQKLYTDTIKDRRKEDVFKF